MSNDNRNTVIARFEEEREWYEANKPKPKYRYGDLVYCIDQTSLRGKTGRITEDGMWTGRTFLYGVRFDESLWKMLEQSILPVGDQQPAENRKPGNYTHFVNDIGDWVKGIDSLVPNLAVGQTIKLMGDKSEDYAEELYRITDIETTIGKSSGVVIQHVVVVPIGK